MFMLGWVFLNQTWAKALYRITFVANLAGFFHFSIFFHFLYQKTK